MLKSQHLQLSGRDAPGPLTDPLVITELPALVADRYARAALNAIGAPLDGGVVSLAMRYLPELLRDADRAMALLEPFVQASRPVKDWRNVLALQQTALALHVSFLLGRPQLEIPVRLQAASITHPGGDVRVHFCSSHIATVLHSGRATYRELETVLSTEDVFNLVELANVESIRDWHAHQSTNRTPGP